MKLRKYRTEDAVSICGWIGDETGFYEWSAGVLGEYPITAARYDSRMQESLEAGRFCAMTYADEEDRPLGHLIIRYPDPEDDSLVRFGFVIIDPELRGRGMGHELIDSACKYARDTLDAAKATIAVFLQNEKAVHCYTSAGFRNNGGVELYRVPLGEWESMVMEKAL